MERVIDRQGYAEPDRERKRPGNGSTKLARRMHKKRSRDFGKAGLLLQDVLSCFIDI